MSDWIEPVVPGVDIKKIGRDAQEMFVAEMPVNPDDMLAILHEFGVALARSDAANAVIAAAAVTNRLFMNDDITVEEGNYTSEFMDAGMALHHALVAYEATR